MKFIVGLHYWSEDKYEMTVVNRFDGTNLLRVEVGFGLPANYKIRRGYKGREWLAGAENRTRTMFGFLNAPARHASRIEAKGHIFWA